MAPIHSLFNEIRFELLKVVILNAFLDATILFLLLLLVLSVFSFGIIWPLAISFVFLGIQVRRYAKRYSLRYIEEKNPIIQEMLRTASDNKDQDTLMAHALFSDIIERIRHVSGGTFLNFQRILLKLCVLFALSFLLVSLAFFNVNMQKFENPLRSVEDKLTGFWGKLTGDTNLTANISEADESIYGEPSVAKLGNTALNLTLQQNLNQIDFNKVNTADKLGSALDSYPADVGAQASQAYTGGLQDVNDRKAAADYSQQIKK